VATPSGVSDTGRYPDLRLAQLRLQQQDLHDPIPPPAVATVGLQNSDIYATNVRCGLFGPRTRRLQAHAHSAHQPQSRPVGLRCYLQASAGVALRRDRQQRLLLACSTRPTSGGSMAATHHTRETDDSRQQSGTCGGILERRANAARTHPAQRVVPARVFPRVQIHVYVHRWRSTTTSGDAGSLNPPVLPGHAIISSDGSSRLPHDSNHRLNHRVEEAPRRHQRAAGHHELARRAVARKEDRLIYTGVPTSTTRSTTGAIRSQPTRAPGTPTTCHGRYFASVRGSGTTRIPDFAKVLQADEQRYAAGGIEDPTVGLYSATNSSRGLQ